MQKTWLKNSILCGLVLSTMVMIQPVAGAADVNRPDAGKTLEGIKQKEIVLPQKKVENLKVEEAARLPLMADAGVTFSVKAIRLSGDVLFPEAELQKLIEDGSGKESSLADLQKLADRITAHYQAKGYIVARAYLPAQRIEAGIVEIAVLAGKYDKVILRNQTSIQENAIQLAMGKVESGSYIEKKALERAVWLISDLSGAEAKATLAPGAQSGTSDLILTILPKGVRMSANVSIDNYGNRFTGKSQVSANTTILNPIHRGDALSLSAITTGSGLNNGSLMYAVPALLQGGRMEVSYSRMNYELGADYASLNASGIADTVSVNYTYNLHRSRNANLYGQIGFASKKLQDSVGVDRTDKKTNVWTIGVSGDSLDRVGGGGANSYSAMYSVGRLNIESPNAQILDEGVTGLKTNGSYGKWNFSAARQQYINDRLSLLLFWNGQLARKNLDSSEKMSLGGAYGVRAYPKGEASGDEGMMLISEMRWAIPMKENQGILQMVGFFDTGTVRTNKAPITNEVNSRTLYGAGMGIIWNDPGKTMVRVHYAWKVGSEVAKSDMDSNGRLWLQMTKYF